MQEYNFTIKHQPGKTNTKADILSRQTGHPKGEHDIENVTLLKEQLFRKIEIRLDEESYIWLILLSDISKTHRRYFDKQVEQGIKKKDPDFQKNEE